MPDINNSDLKVKLAEEGFEVSEKIGQLKLMAEAGENVPEVKTFHISNPFLAKQTQTF